MDLNEAISIAKRVKGRYQAFERIEEVLRLAASMEASIGDLQTQIGDLRAELSVLTDTKSGLVDDIAGLQTSYEAKASGYENARQEAEEALKTSLEAGAADFETATKKLDADLSRRKAHAEAALRRLQNQQTGVQSSIDSGRAELDRIRDVMRNLQKSLPTD